MKSAAVKMGRSDPIVAPTGIRNPRPRGVRAAATRSPLSTPAVMARSSHATTARPPTSLDQKVRTSRSLCSWVGRTMETLSSGAPSQGRSSTSSSLARSARRIRRSSPNLSRKEVTKSPGSDSRFLGRLALIRAAAIAVPPPGIEAVKYR